MGKDLAALDIWFGDLAFAVKVEDVEEVEGYGHFLRYASDAANSPEPPHQMLKRNRKTSGVERDYFALNDGGLRLNVMFYGCHNFGQACCNFAESSAENFHSVGLVCGFALYAPSYLYSNAVLPPCSV